MFVDKFQGWDTRNGQRARGSFLILWSDLDKKKLYGCMRYVEMQQLGHFMMGSAKVCGKELTLSGTYGNDGLGRDLGRDGIDATRLMELPSSLYEAWAKGGGWNSAGSEARAMKKWALANKSALQKAGR